ncbi:hypothetical protein [Limnobacter alexandrii]|uniref:hypothetical protein n=1 Tax=Limnobacter alexandrii TaxID=2570352 RepID=UPI001BB17AFD|nr:hypothetical protein [Limnobacter alexandrii]
MAEAFASSLKPEGMISSLELVTGQVFNPATDLLILDEIGKWIEYWFAHGFSCR